MRDTMQWTCRAEKVLEQWSTTMGYICVTLLFEFILLELLLFSCRPAAGLSATHHRVFRWTPLEASRMEDKQVFQIKVKETNG